LKNTVSLTKDAHWQIKAVQDVEQYKKEKLTYEVQGVASSRKSIRSSQELKVVDATIARTGAQIAQSPERIKRSILVCPPACLKRRNAWHESAEPPSKD
jgi:hypothetical protein